MFKNYFRTAFRNLLQDKSHSLINITGLSVGLAVAMLIGLWIDDEVSFDKNFTHYDRIAQVIQNVTNNGEVQTWRDVPCPLGEELRKNYGADFTQVITGITESSSAPTDISGSTKGTWGFCSEYLEPALQGLYPAGGHLLSYFNTGILLSHAGVAAKLSLPGGVVVVDLRGGWWRGAGDHL